MKFSDLKKYPHVFGDSGNSFELNGEERFYVYDGFLAYLDTDRQSPIDIITRYEDSDETVIVVLKNDEEVYLDVDEDFSIIYSGVNEPQPLEESDEYIVTLTVKLTDASKVADSTEAAAMAFNERELEALGFPKLSVRAPDGTISIIDTSEWA